jgi:hypothetical protein
LWRAKLCSNHFVRKTFASKLCSKNSNNSNPLRLHRYSQLFSLIELKVDPKILRS